MRALVVGAGIAGLACGQVLVDAGVEVRSLDRGRKVGGRLASRRIDGRPVDLGASYFTASDPGFAALVENWTDRGLAREWTDTFVTSEGEPKPGPLRYGAPSGLRSLAEDLAVGLQVESIITVESVRRIDGGLSVDGETYDVVVLAMPEPQAHRLLDETARRSLPAPVDFQPVVALAARFPHRSWDFDGMFVNDDPVLAWIADDGSRRGDGAPVLVAHSTGDFARPRLDDPAAAEPELSSALSRLVGAEPVSTFVHRWTYAKPIGGHDEPYALVDGLGLCGDSWSDRPRVESAWLSGRALANALLA